MATPKKYNEFRVHSFKGKKPDEMFPTKRGSVSIHEHEADLNNANVRRTKLFYVLDEKPKGGKSKKEVTEPKTEV